MANVTDPFAEAVHGTNPQNLVEKITRLKIYDCLYWKEQCFGLTAETIIDKAVMLKYCGGIYGGNVKPTPFLCLTLKLLQLQPEKEIIYEFIKNEDFKYLRLLGAFYLRLVGRPIEVYHYLEPLYNDYRKFAYRSSTGWSLRHIDEFIDDLFHQELVCDITLPFLPKREKLESLGGLRARRSALDEELDSSSSDEEEQRMDEDMIAEAIAEEAEASKRRAELQESDTLPPEVDAPAVAADSAVLTTSQHSSEADNTSVPSVGPPRPPAVTSTTELAPASNEVEVKAVKPAEDTPNYGRDSRRDDDKYERSDDRRRRDSRERRSRHRDRRRSRSRERHRDSRRRSRERRRRSYSRSSSRSRSDSRDRRRHRSRSATRHKDRNGSDAKTDTKSISEVQDSVPGKSATVNAHELRRIAAAAKEEDERLYANSTAIEPKKFKHSSKRFDKAFGKKSSVSGASGVTGGVSAPADSVEYWNQMRAQMGLKKLDG